MKELWSKISGFAIPVIFAFAAFFSPNGLGVVVDGYGWLNTAGEIIENFVTIMAIISLLSSIVILGIIFYGDGYIEKAAGAVIKVNGDVDTAYEKYKFGFWTFTLFTIPYWSIMVAAGWIFTTICFIFALSAVNINRYLIREEIGKQRTITDSNDDLFA